MTHPHKCIANSYRATTRDCPYGNHSQSYYSLERRSAETQSFSCPRMTQITQIIFLEHRDTEAQRFYMCNSAFIQWMQERRSALCRGIPCGCPQMHSRPLSEGVIINFLDAEVFMSTDDTNGHRWIPYLPKP